MSKNRLHTLSKYEADRLNKNAFMPAYNIFDTGGIKWGVPSTEKLQGWADNWYETTASKYTQKSIDAANAGNDNAKNKYDGKRAKLDADVAKYGSVTEAYKHSKNALGISKQANPFSKMNIGQTFGTLASVAPRELFDTLDPVYHLAGGRESTVGNGLSETGVGLFKAGVQSGNPALMLAGAGAKTLGGLWNGAFGVKWNKENIADVENNITRMRAANLNSVNSNAALLDAWGNVNLGYDFNQDYIGKNGWFNHKATRKYNKLNAMQRAARAYVQHQLGVAANQADRTQDDLAQSTFTYSNGGFLDNLDTNDMGSAIKYSLAQDYLTMKNNKINTDAKMTNMYAGTPGTFFAEGGPLNVLCGGGKMFAIGGDMQEYSVGQIYDVSESEANRLKAMGYEFKIVG